MLLQPKRSIKIFIALALLSSVKTTIAQKADIVFTNANVVTLIRPAERMQAVAIKDHQILAVGSNASIKKYIGPATKINDLHGKTILPGFNDVHQHPYPIYPFKAQYAALQLDTISSMAGLLKLLREKAAITPKGMLITGFGYNENLLGGTPIRDSLDKASTDHPILIRHISGHLCAANSFLLNINDITDTTIDPAGGAFERYKGNMPDGICKESAMAALSRSNKIIYPAQPNRQEELAGYRKYFNNMLAAGLTSIGDAWVTPQKVAIYQQLVKENFPMRFNLLIGMDYLDDVIAGKIPKIESDYLRIKGIKVFHGNSLSGKTCWLSQPYNMVNPSTGKMDYYGIPPARSQGSLDSLVQKIQAAGLQMACHSNGDREIDMVLSAIEKAQKTNFQPNNRHRIEHCSITDQGILERIKADSIIPVFHCYMYELGEKLTVYGEERMKMIHPTKTALDMGIPFALHSDYPISYYGAMVRLGSAVNRETKQGLVIGENQKITPEEAIDAYTAGGAYTTFEENKKGKIAAGQFADLIVLDADPTTIDPEKIYNIKVLMTMVGGKMAFSNIGL